MEQQFRTQFVNSLSGFKSLFLIGTKSTTGQGNLAIFNSVIHIGANPAMLGFVCRPDSVDRHTLENIMDTKYYTLNAVGKDFYEMAHQTAARYDRGQSEFEATGLSDQNIDDFHAPFVKESELKIAMKLQERYDIKANGTHLIIGSVENVYLSDEAISDDGYINLEELGIITGTGLDAYHDTHLISRLPYAKAKS